MGGGDGPSRVPRVAEAHTATAAAAIRARDAVEVKELREEMTVDAGRAREEGMARREDGKGGERGR